MPNSLYHLFDWHVHIKKKTLKIKLLYRPTMSDKSNWGIPPTVNSNNRVVTFILIIIIYIININ